MITFAGELLSQAEDLLRKGVHPSDIVVGYKLAAAKTQELLRTMVCHTVEASAARDVGAMGDVLRAVVASKHYGYEDILTPLIAEACVATMPAPPRKPTINVDNVRVAKLIGGAVTDSQVIRGLVVQRDADGTVKHVEKAKVAVFGIGIEASDTETKGMVVIKSADELKAYNRSEETMMEEIIKGLADAGVTVVVAGGSVSEIAMHFIEKVRSSLPPVATGVYCFH